jgi:hypothetical protein
MARRGDPCDGTPQPGLREGQKPRSNVRRHSRREPHNRTAADGPALAKLPRAHAPAIVAHGVLR